MDDRRLDNVARAVTVGCTSRRAALKVVTGLILAALTPVGAVQGRRPAVRPRRGLLLESMPARPVQGRGNLPGERGPAGGCHLRVGRDVLLPHLPDDLRRRRLRPGRALLRVGQSAPREYPRPLHDQPRLLLLSLRRGTLSNQLRVAPTTRSGRRSGGGSAERRVARRPAPSPSVVHFVLVPRTAAVSVGRDDNGCRVNNGERLRSKRVLAVAAPTLWQACHYRDHDHRADPVTTSIPTPAASSNAS